VFLGERNDADMSHMPFSSEKKAKAHEGVVSIACPSGKAIVLPPNGVLFEHGQKRILWCPNAKVATSTIFSTFAWLQGTYSASNSRARADGKLTSIHNLVQSGQAKKLCDGLPFSFTVVRNPWDRVYSAYLDKINRVAFVPNHKNATFQQFLHAIPKFNPTVMNPHWQPASEHCVTAGPNRFRYSKVYKLEKHFEESIAEAFGHLGYSEERIRAAMANIGRQNVGKSEHTTASRLKAYETPEARQIIRDVYRDDIEVGSYEFGSG